MRNFGCERLEYPPSEFMPSEELLKEILENAKVIAIVGLSENRERPSYRVGRFLKARGYTIIPVNPKYATVFGLKSYPRLSAIPQDVDIVDIFRRGDAVGPIVDEAIEIGAKVIWMQEGVINHEAAKKAKDAGLEVVMDRCIYKTYNKLFLGG
jgi:predicted CoA-binding protein